MVTVKFMVKRRLSDMPVTTGAAVVNKYFGGWSQYTELFVGRLRCLRKSIVFIYIMPHYLNMPDYGLKICKPDTPPLSWFGYWQALRDVHS